MTPEIVDPPAGSAGGSTHPTIPARWDPWQWAVATYLARYQRRTRGAYGAGLRRWSAWCADHGLDPMHVQEAHISVWLRHLDEEAGLVARTVAGYATPVIGVYRLAHRHGWIDRNPAAYIEPPSTPRISTTLSLTRDELARVLGIAADAHPALSCAVHLWGLNGTRWGETLAIDIDHIGRHGDLPTIHLPHRKGGVPGTIALSPPTWTAVQRVVDGRTTGPLLLGPAGVRIGKHALRRRWRTVLDTAGVDRRITPHGLRHSFVTLALDAGVTVRDIMASTGHTDSSMVDYYDRARASIERNCTHTVTAHVLGAPDDDDVA